MNICCLFQCTTLCASAPINLDISGPRRSALGQSQLRSKPMKLNNLFFQKNLKYYLLVVFMFSVLALFIRSIIVNPPASGGHIRMKMMKSDMQRLLLREGTVVLDRNEVQQSQVASISIIVRPEGWGMRPLPRDEKLLNEMGWRKLSEVDNSFCKDKVKLIFTGSTYQNQGSISIAMRFNNQTVADCNS